jgi:hypothetical protein
MNAPVKKFPEREYGGIKSFEGIEVGDKFLRNDHPWHSIPELVTCSKVTAKQCVIGGKTYRIADALELGRNQWSTVGHPKNFTPEAYAAAKRERKLRWCRSKLEGLRWDKVPDEKIEAVWAVVGELVDPPKEAA